MNEINLAHFCYLSQCTTNQSLHYCISGFIIILCQAGLYRVSGTVLLIFTSYHQGNCAMMLKQWRIFAVLL